MELPLLWSGLISFTHGVLCEITNGLMSCTARLSIYRRVRLSCLGSAPSILKQYVRKCPKTSHASNFSRVSIRRCAQLSWAHCMFVGQIRASRLSLRLKKFSELFIRPMSWSMIVISVQGTKLFTQARLNNFVTVKYQCQIYERMLYAVRCLKSNEDMILALSGQFKQLSHEPEKFR